MKQQQKLSKQEILQKNKLQKKTNIQVAKKTFFKQYISSEENRNYTSGDRLVGLNNRFNFLGILEGGFYSDGYKYIEVACPPAFDMSQVQERGFSLFFWIGFNKQPNNVTRYILRKGISPNEITPTIGLLPNNSNLFVKIYTSNQKVENIISNKKLEPGKIYSICLTLNFDTNESLTEMSLYIDGTLDSQISLPGTPLMNDGNFFFGKYESNSHGFIGNISEVMLIPGILEDTEIEEINNRCWDEFINSNGLFFNTAVVLEEKLERNILLEKYVQQTGNQGFIIDNLSLTNQELKEIVKQYDNKEEKKNNEDNDLINNNNLIENQGLKEEYNNLQESNNDLSQIESTTLTIMKKNLEKLMSNEDDFIRVKKFFLNHKLIGIVLYLANEKQDIMELKRVVDIFEVLGENMLFEVDLFFITNLAKGLNAIIPDNKKYFSLSVFFTNLIQAHEIYFPEEEASQYIPTESNIFEQNYNLENDNNNNVVNYNMAAARQNSAKPFKDLYDDSDGLTRNIQEDFVIKSLYPPKGKNKEDISPVMNNDLVNLEEKNNNINNINDQNNINVEGNKKVNSKDDLTFVTSTKGGTKVDLLKEESKNGELLNENIEKKVEQENIKENENENEENNEEREWKPEYPENWADGNFELIINHCYKCEDHTTTTRHMEFQFIDKFNEIAEGLQMMFPNAKIYGNYDDLEYFGCFDVYIHGIGPFFDNKGRYFLFKRNAKGRFPRITELTDRLVALSMVYGGSINMEKAQRQFISENASIIGKKSRYFHENPAILSAKGEEIKNRYYNSKSRLNSKIDMNTTKFICTNWGCGKEFVQANNTNKSCIYHSGVWQFGSINGYWPECWSCCEGTWDSEGCTIGYHKGIKKDEKTYLCLNHGELNPQTKRPDSACGKYFLEGAESGCFYHTGYLKKGFFTCCGGDKESKGCFEDKHQTKKYPDIKAKLYFYPKPIINPGIKYKITDKKEEPIQQFNIGEQICKCDYFKKITVPYKPITNNSNVTESEEKAK